MSKCVAVLESQKVTSLKVRKRESRSRKSKRAAKK